MPQSTDAVAQVHHFSSIAVVTLMKHYSVTFGHAHTQMDVQTNVLIHLKPISITISVRRVITFVILFPCV